MISRNDARSTKNNKEVCEHINILMSLSNRCLIYFKARLVQLVWQIYLDNLFNQSSPKQKLICFSLNIPKGVSCNSK